jgi:4-diphosphocytidyl-2-C-methyl-D-erythritol kinase
MTPLKAYAKINLGLRILNKREDGYHNIETIFHRVNIFDEITFSPSDDIQLSCDQKDIPTDNTNLSTRAALLLQETYAVKQGVRIRLKKNIPVGAGLGGGSSDAATTMIGLTQFWKLSVDNNTLLSLALRLGSDVPYFLQPGSAHATGRGEVLEYVDLELPYTIVVVYPGIHISTAWAYENSKIENQKSKIPLKQILLDNLCDAQRLLPLLSNDFESLVLRTHEPVARVKKGLYDAGAVFAQMSGSGSSVYGLFTNDRLADDAAEELRKQYGVFITEKSFQAEHSSPFGRGPEGIP